MIATMSDLSLTEVHSDIIVAAALLHDADDPKLFATRDYANARGALSLAGVFPATAAHIINCIKLVSCSTQAYYEVEIDIQPWMLVARDADRLDAIGIGGVVRCLEYGDSIGRPLAVRDTPLPRTRAELLQCVDVERFERYKRGVPSASTIDHFFDKLVHFRCNDSGNVYLAEAAAVKYEGMISAMLDVIAKATTQH